jgi:hypothetical protein
LDYFLLITFDFLQKKFKACLFDPAQFKSWLRHWVVASRAIARSHSHAVGRGAMFQPMVAVLLLGATLTQVGSKLSRRW